VKSHIHWAPLVVALTVGLLTWFVAHRLKLNERWKGTTGAPHRSDRWLLLMTVLQWLAVLHALGDVAGSLSPQRLASAAASGPYRYGGYIASIVALVLLFVFVLWSAIMMHRRSRLFPRLFRIEMVLLLFVPILIALWFTWETERGKIPQMVSVLFWVRVAIFAPAAGIGYVYSLRSATFRDTFSR
jgi:hypothetical protein